MGVTGADEDDSGVPSSAKEGLAFYVVDRDVEGSPVSENKSDSSSDQKKEPWWRRILKRKKQPKMDCLTYDANGQVTVNTCTRKVSWAWEMNDGVLKTLGPDSSMTNQCLINQQADVALGSCAGSNESNMVNLSVVRYRAVSLPDALQHLSTAKEKDTTSPRVPESSTETQTEGRASESKANLPSRRRDLAHLQASKPSHHPNLKNSSKPSLARNEATKQEPRQQKPAPLRILHGASPILAGEKSFRTKQSSSTGSTQKVIPSTAPHRTRKIPVHPYIATAKNEIWTDPQTGLEYPTDLSGYLKHDRKVKGRQTLTGVGQYRKGYVIKVYGVAFYVSKRDVLADPFFSDYADMSPDELKARPEFYEHLRLHPENFERTIIIKINMQLAADTIRSSLHADWKMLTEEAKTTLISSSLQPRPASEEFLKKVADESNNPGRCSCGQVCPEEYHADLDCCARGTELGFTWLKSGDLEVRL